MAARRALDDPGVLPLLGRHRGKWESGSRRILALTVRRPKVAVRRSICRTRLRCGLIAVAPRAPDVMEAAG